MNRIKFFFQKMFRGFSDDELYSLDYSLAMFLLPRLIRFREINGVVPGKFENCHQWNRILDDMIDGFARVVRAPFLKDVEETKIIDRAYKLLYENYWCLWF